MGCQVCDAFQSSPRGQETYWDNRIGVDELKDTFAALMAITSIQEFEHSPKDRVLMALAIGRIFNHISDASYLDMENCDLAKWLLASMSRSQREVRIASV